MKQPEKIYILDMISLFYNRVERFPLFLRLVELQFHPLITNLITRHECARNIFNFTAFHPLTHSLSTSKFFSYREELSDSNKKQLIEYIGKEV